MPGLSLFESDWEGVESALLQIALRTSLAVRSEYDSQNYRVESKSDNSPLTNADILANEICKRNLLALIPGAGWLSEESVDSEDRVQKKYVWIVDPIDGTREFVNRNGEFAVSIGLASGDKAILGIVVLPAEDRLVFASQKGGLWDIRFRRGEDDEVIEEGETLVELGPETAPEILKHAFSEKTRKQLTRKIKIFVQKKRPHFHPVKTLKESRILVSRSEWEGGVFGPLEGDLIFIQGGSIARKLALTSVGEADLTISLYPKNEWDICGGAALLSADARNGMISLGEMKPQKFNQYETKSYGVAAGRVELIREFKNYFIEKNLDLKTFYS